MLKMMSLYHTYMNLMEMSFTSAATIVLIILAIFYHWYKNRDVLPGPVGVPYLGIYLFLRNKNVLSKMDKYKKKYGDIYSFTYSGRLYISLSSIEAIRELNIHKSDCFTERYKGHYIVTEMVGNGLGFLNGDSWGILKKFFIEKFYDYEQKIFWSNFDDWMAAVVDLLICSPDERRDAEANTAEYFTRHFTVIMNEILFGKSGANHEDIQKMVEAFRPVFESYKGVNSLLSGPVAMLLFKMNSRLRKNLDNFQSIKSIIKERIKGIESSMTEDEPRCIIEEYFRERNIRRRKNDPSWKFFSDETLIESLFHFVGHGSLSFGTFMANAINALAKYPEEQEKVFTEILHEIGPDRQPLRVDKSYLPYTNAFINECIRTSKFMLIMPSLQCTNLPVEPDQKLYMGDSTIREETFIRGYRIPKGSVTLLNFWSAHNDPEMFEDPHIFNPSRYFFRENKGRMPVLFGMGKRMCTGESFVMLQIFVCLATMVKNFSFLKSDLPEETNFAGEKSQLMIVPRTEHLYNHLSQNQMNVGAKSCILQ